MTKGTLNHLGTKILPIVEKNERFSPPPLLWHCYVPKINFYIMIFSLGKKTSTFKTLIVSCNWIDQILV